MNKTLTVSGYNRPDYFTQTLRALSACDGVGEYDIVCVLDRSDKTDELVEIAKQMGLTTLSPVEHMGCGATIRYCMETGFRNSDFHVHLEDDTVPSPDCLRWFEWAANWASPMTLTISAYNQHGGEAEPEMASFRKWFTPWGWATWRSHWEKYLALSWDNSFWDGGIQRIRSELAMGELYPRVSRIQNIGATRGAFCPSAEFHQENHHATRVATAQEKKTRWIVI